MSSSQSSAAGNGLTKEAFNSFKLKDRKKHNHNTDLFIFSLADEKAELDLPVSSCLMTKFVGLDGEDVVRPYTPINQADVGVINLLVKLYPQGKMSNHIHKLQVGDKLDIKGPMPKLKYEHNKYKSITLIAGGTGITPMLQIIDEVFADEADKTQVTLLTANTSGKDVLLREKIDGLVQKHKDQFKAVYICDKKEPGEDWIQEEGHINKAMLDKYLPTPSQEVFVYTCGPPKFMEMLSGDKLPDKSQGPLTGLLKDMGFSEKNVYKQ